MERCRIVAEIAGRQASPGRLPTLFSLDADPDVINAARRAIAKDAPPLRSPFATAWQRPVDEPGSGGVSAV